MTNSDDDFPLPTEPLDEWTWMDDLQFAFRVIMIIISVVAAAGLLLWMVMK